MADHPVDGDVIITTEDARHLLSIFPHPDRLTMNEYHRAFQIANKWAQANKAAVWQRTDGVFTKLSSD